MILRALSSQHVCCLRLSKLDSNYTFRGNFPWLIYGILARSTGLKEHLESTTLPLPNTPFDGPIANYGK